MNTYEQYIAKFDKRKPVKPTLPKDMLDINELKKYTEKVNEYNIALQEYKVEYKKYCKEQASLDDKFKHDLAAEYGTDKLPDNVQCLIFSKAYEDGHADGYQSVEYHYEELAEFVLKILEYMK